MSFNFCNKTTHNILTQIKIMKFFALVSCLSAAVALPTHQEPQDDTMPGMLVQLMKDAFSPPASESGQDPVMKDVMNLMSGLASQGQSHSTAAPSSIMDDPMIKTFATLAQTAMAASSSTEHGANAEEKQDPMLKMGSVALKAFLDTMSDSPADAVSEETTPKTMSKLTPKSVVRRKAAEDPLAPVLKMMTKALQALITDKNGDPVGAVFNVVLEDPLLSQNPVIKAIKAAISDTTGDPVTAMIDSLMENPELQKDPYVPSFLRIAKNVVANMPKDGESGDPLAAFLNALAPSPTAIKSPRAPKDAAPLSTPEIVAH
jgi:hypothetical protein